MKIHEIKNLIKEAIEQELSREYGENWDEIGFDPITKTFRPTPRDRTSPVKILLKPLNKSDKWWRPIYKDINTNKIYVDINLGQGEPEICDVTNEGEPNTPLRKGSYEIVSENKIKINNFKRFIEQCVKEVIAENDNYYLNEVLQEGRSVTRLTIKDREELSKLFASHYLQNNAVFVYVPPNLQRTKLDLPRNYIQISHFRNILTKPEQLLNNRGFKLGGYLKHETIKKQSTIIPNRVYNITTIYRPLFHKISEEEGYFIIRNCRFVCITVHYEKDGIFYFKINAYIQPTN
ncbi:MAG TPA: hypothetical protein PKX15_06340 [Bacteroidales bacterium]|nr:hypothetical protein [Bacteroidales bacterium]